MAKWTQGYIYIIHNPAWKGWYKIGRTTTSPEQRLYAYQTSSPFRDFKIVFSRYTEDITTTEFNIYSKLEQLSIENKHEWYNIELNQAITIINKECL